MTYTRSQRSSLDPSHSGMYLHLLPRFALPAFLHHGFVSDMDLLLMIKCGSQHSLSTISV
jgi:hypothetical protein